MNAQHTIKQLFVNRRKLIESQIKIAKNVHLKANQRVTKHTDEIKKLGSQIVSVEKVIQDIHSKNTKNNL